MSHQILYPNTEAMYVENVPTYVDVHGILKKIITLTDPTSGVGIPSNILANGHHGLGKSLLAANLTVALEKKAKKRVPMVTFDCSEDTFELTLMGSSRVVAGGETPFVPGPFPTVIHLANETGLCVFCVEEISALTPGAQKVFNRLTDWRKGLYVPDVGKTFALNPDCHIIIISTMNPSGYGGVYSLNADLRSRFDEIIVPFPTRVQETRILKSVCPYAGHDLISKAIQLGLETRSHATSYSLSTRDLVRFLSSYHRLDAVEGEVAFALEMVANKFEGSDRVLILDRINAIFGTAF